MLLMNPNKGICEGFLISVFLFLLPTNAFCSGGAGYVRRRGREEPGWEAEDTR